MKKNDTGDFSVLYVEPDDERVDLFLVIAGQKKPVVLMLAEQVRVFQRPDDFTALKYLKRQQNLTIIFVIAQGGQMAQMAAKNGFPVYLSMDGLIKAVSMGQVARQRSLSRPTAPLGTASGSYRVSGPLSTSGLAGPTSASGLTGPLSGPGLAGPTRASGLTGSLSASGFAGPSSASGLTGPMSGPGLAGPSSAPGFAGPTRASGPSNVPGFSGPSSSSGLTGAASTQYAQKIRNNTAMRTVPLAQEIDMSYSEYVATFRQDAQDVTSTLPLPDEPLPLPLDQPSRVSQQVAQAAQAARALTPPPLYQGPEDYPTQPVAPHKPRSTSSMPLTKPLRPRSLLSRRSSLLLLILTVALVFGVAGAFLFMPHALQSEAAPAPAIIGEVSYVSSGQVSESSSQGIADKVVADFNNLPDPAAHKSYYAWLLSDKKLNDPQSILLGPLQVNRGQAHLVYGGDAQHTNLLLISSRVLVTEEDAAVPPIAPSLDPNTWRFYGEISSDPINGPNNPQHYSYLDHLRHLLAADPTLDELELPGGLNNWLYQNTSKVFEWASSTRGQWEETKDTAYVKRQAMRILEYLDGTTFLYQDLPKGTPLLVNERLARIGLLAVNGPNQDPPSYLAHVDKHLNGLLQASVVTPATRKQVNDLIGAMNNVEFWLTQVRRDAQQVVKMSDDQLRQPATLTLLDDMIENSNRAYAGQLDPSTNSTRQGIIWLHDHMQALAHIDIAKVQPSSAGNMPQLVPPGGQPRAFTPFGIKK